MLNLLRGPLGGAATCPAWWQPIAVLSVCAMWLVSQPMAVACPFCSAVSQTLRQEMGQTDAVAFAKMVPGSETESDALFEILSVVRGENLIQAGQEVRVNYFGKAKPDQSFMLLGVDPPDLLWSTPQPVSQAAIDYVEAVNKLSSKESLERLKFYIRHLEHPDTLVARDAYDEFASAPYPEIKQLKELMDREQLLVWIQDTSLPPDRKRLYLVMLGVCGQAEDADLLEKLLRSDDPNRRAGLDAMIACYATLRGEAGLELIDELFLANKQSQYADTYAAIMALRFHGTDGGVIPKERVLESMRLILDRPELADLVIPDLARWEDWSQIDKLVELFKSADEKSSWVRVPVINYLRACPLEKAETQLGVLKEIDPAAFKRATSFFPVPKSSAGSSDSSSTLSPATARQLAARELVRRSRNGEQLAAVVPAPAGRGLGTPLLAVAPTPNRSLTASVVAMVSATLWLSMWLSISGAGRHGLVAWCLRGVDGLRS